MSILETDEIIIALIDGNYLNIAEFCRLKILSKEVKSIIECYWNVIESQFIKSIGQMDINHAANLVIRNSALLTKAIKERRLQTGYLFSANGDLVIANAMQVLPDVNEGVKELIAESPIATLVMERDGGILSPHKHAFKNNLSALKNALQHNDMFPFKWEMVFTAYFAGLLHHNIRDYKINWEVVNEWCNTPFYQFIRGPIRANYYASLVASFNSLCTETRRREHQNIMTFIRRFISPLVRKEYQLIKRTLAGDLEDMDLHGYDLPYAHTPEDMKFQTFQSITNNSIIRAVLAPVFILDENLFKEYFEIAHEIYDMRDDKHLHAIPLSVVLSGNYDLAHYVHKHYPLHINGYTLLAVAKGKLPIEILEDSGISTMVLRLLRGEDIENIEVNEEDDLYERPGLSGVVSTLNNQYIWWTVNQCYKILEQLQLKITRILPYHQIFFTRDLGFWKHFLEQCKDEYAESSLNLVSLILFHADLLSVDVVKYALTLMEHDDIRAIYLELQDNVVPTLLGRIIEEFAESKKIDFHEQDGDYSSEE